MYINQTARIPTPTLIAIIVSCVVFVLFIAMIIVFCRCKKTQKKVKKEYEMETAT
jgi:echinoid protein